MRPVCVPCRRFYRCEKNEFNWEEGMPTTPESQMGMRPVADLHEDPERFAVRLAEWESGWGPYKIWTGDKWKCPGCHTEIIVGVPARPWAEYDQPDYDESVRVHKPQIRVNDC